MKILFLDQSGELGGAELCLTDIAKPYRDRCLVALFADGPFRNLLERQHIPVEVLTTRSIHVSKESSWIQGISSLYQLVPLIVKVIQLSREYNLIYANTQKALVIGAVASFFSRRPLVYHLHDILSEEHFSKTNRRVAVTLANSASLVIANSKATQVAFVNAGGLPEITRIIYNGFEPECYQNHESNRKQVRHHLGLSGQFVVGHFSRLSPWKGQHVLIEALAHCSENVSAIFVGDALFGEQDYIRYLHQKVAELGLKERVHFLGFRSDIVPLMTACDLVAHTSIAPEPFGRVIVEAMLCGRPVVAAEAGGAVELVEHGRTGWLVSPGNSQKLADVITTCCIQPEQAIAVANEAQIQANQRFHLTAINQQVSQLLCQYGAPTSGSDALDHKNHALRF